MARPWVSVIGVSAVLLFLAIPVLSLTTGTEALNQFPKDSDVRTGNQLASQQLGGGTDPIQIGFSRFVVSLIMVLWLVGQSEAGFAALRTKRPLEHAARAFCAAVELTAFYFAISKLPLPTAMSIVAASPIFGTLLGIVFLRVHPLRSADALQLAAAFMAAERRPPSLELVTLDDRLATAARKEGFVLVDLGAAG